MTGRVSQQAEQEARWDRVSRNRNGRNRLPTKRLKMSVTAMAVPSFLIGLLPGYETLGLLAPLALILLRMIQGFSVGDEYISTFLVMFVYMVPIGRKLFSNLHWSGCRHRDVTTKGRGGFLAENSVRCGVQPQYRLI